MDKRMLSFLRKIAISGALIAVISLFLLPRNIFHENITLGLFFGGAAWLPTAGVFWFDEIERAQRKSVYQAQYYPRPVINNWAILFGIVFTIVVTILAVCDSPDKKLMVIIPCVMEVLVLVRILLLRI